MEVIRLEQTDLLHVYFGIRIALQWFVRELDRILELQSKEIMLGGKCL